MKVFIGGGSNENVRNVYYNEARNMAMYLSSKKYNLICGSCTGIMKDVLNIFKQNFRKICIYETLCYQKSKYNYDFKLFQTIKERKNSLIADADLIIFLPGGIGTYDEIFTSIELKRAGEIDKKIIILNVDGYYNQLLSMLDKMYNEQFANKKDKNNYIVLNNTNELKQKI